MVRSRSRLPRQVLEKLALAFALALLVSGPVLAGEFRSRVDSATLAYQSLPAQARRVERAIRAGGPFDHDKDGDVFGNRERHLPSHARGYYREYTVATSLAHDRGAKRIVCGGFEPRQPEVCYYTADHYNSFSRIVK